jgi:hypothetical protein
MVLVDRMGTSIRVMAMHVPSSQRIGVLVVVEVPTVTVDRRVEVVVIVARIGFVAMAVDAAYECAVKTLRRSKSSCDHCSAIVARAIRDLGNRIYRHERR